MKKILTIAGSDSIGGAGIQADIKTITMHKMYAMSVITAVTAQNTTGVYGISDMTPAFVSAQLDCVFNDILPDSVKIGMVSNRGIISVISDKLKKYKPGSIVLDPVMVSTSGSRLIEEESKDLLIRELLPLATVITPNLPESSILSGLPVRDQKDMVNAACKISSFYAGYILIKGGHLDSEAVDLLYANGTCHWFHSKKINNPNTHGTGCTLSSAIACNLALGYPIETSIERAKNYVSGAIGAMLDIGKGSGPLDHMFLLKRQEVDHATENVSL